MSIMSRQGIDARESARMLAARTLACFEQAPQSLGEYDHNALNNMFRLVSGYRAHGYYGMGNGDPAAVQLGVMPQTHVADMAQALGAALEAAYPGRTTDEAVDCFTAVLRNLGQPSKHAASEGQRRLAEAFLNNLVQRLSH